MVEVALVERIAVALPEVTVGERHGNRTWVVGKKGFAWERPFTKADVKRFAPATPPTGPIVAVSVADLGEKEAVLAAGTKGVFTMQHFDGYPAVLLQLDLLSKRVLVELLVDVWLAVAPAELAAQHAAALPALARAAADAA